MRFARQCLIQCLIASLIFAGLPVSAGAAIVGTDAAIHGAEADADRARVRAFIARAEVGDYLRTQGVPAEEALARVDALSDAEVRALAQRLDELPAGASVAGDLVGAAVVVFIVLLITDILGFTDIFPFVKKHPRR